MKRRDRPDSLDLLREEDVRLEALLHAWDRASTEAPTPSGAVTNASTRGTAGKLILDHAVVRFAAKADVLAVLRDTRHGALVEHFGDRMTEAGEVLEHLDRLARGVSAIDLRHTEFGAGIGAIRSLWRGELRSEVEYGLARVEDLLGEERSRLRTAHFIRTHASRRPGSPGRLLRRFPGPISNPASFARALFQYVRSFPQPRATSADLLEVEGRGNGTQ